MSMKLKVIIGFIKKHFMHISGIALVVLVCGYLSVSWLGLRLAQEFHLVGNAVDFMYYAMTTISTVGYGDLSPQTPQGRLFVSVFVMPFGLGLFGLVIGKIAVAFGDFWQKGQRGKRHLNLQNHIVIIGTNAKTGYLIDMIRREEQGKRAIVVVSRQHSSSPFDASIYFVQAQSFTREQDLARASLESASTIIIDTALDDETLTVGLFVAKTNCEAHLVAYFEDALKRDLFHQYCPTSECISSLSVELLAKSAIDKGSSVIHAELISTHQGQTQYAIKVPSALPNLSLGQIYMSFKQECHATIIAIQKQGQVPQVNPHLDVQIESGDVVHYIADERIGMDWWKLIGQKRS